MVVEIIIEEEKILLSTETETGGNSPLSGGLLLGSLLLLGNLGSLVLGGHELEASHRKNGLEKSHGETHIFDNHLGKSFAATPVYSHTSNGLLSLVHVETPVENGHVVHTPDPRGGSLSICSGGSILDTISHMETSDSKVASLETRKSDHTDLSSAPSSGISSGGRAVVTMVNDKVL